MTGMVMNSWNFERKGSEETATPGVWVVKNVGLGPLSGGQRSLKCQKSETLLGAWVFLPQAWLLRGQTGAVQNLFGVLVG